MGLHRLSVGESVLRNTHKALSSIFGVVIVSRNLEKTNENDGFKMRALKRLYSVLWFGKSVLFNRSKEINEI